MKGFEYDGLNHNFVVKSGKRIRRFLRYALIFLLSTFSCSVLIFILISFVVSTDSEKILMKENVMYSKIIRNLEDESRRRTMAIAYLQHRDNDIYTQVFHTDAPAIDPAELLNPAFGIDSIPEHSILKYTSGKSVNLMKKSFEIDSLFVGIFSVIADPDSVLPPMMLPVRGLTYSQVGASVGRRMSPFLKALVPHNGLDIISQRGDSVYAVASGVVEAPKALKSQGRVIEITHEGGYESRYAHLEKMFVKVGQNVEAGQAIGTVGMTGNSFAPHLHFEIWHDDQPLNPVNYAFASLGPEEYANMLYMAEYTVQSMD